MGGGAVARKVWEDLIYGVLCHSKVKLQVIATLSANVLFAKGFSFPNFMWRQKTTAREIWTLSMIPLIISSCNKLLLFLLWEIKYLIQYSTLTCILHTQFAGHFNRCFWSPYYKIICEWLKERPYKAVYSLKVWIQRDRQILTSDTNKYNK